MDEIKRNKMIVTTNKDEFFEHERRYYPTLSDKEYSDILHGGSTYCVNCGVFYWDGCKKRCKCSKDILEIFIDRLERIGVNVKLVSNFPWVYIDEINGKHVKENFEAEHGFTVAFLPLTTERKLHFTDITEIFKLIRKYVDNESIQR